MKYMGGKYNERKVICPFIQNIINDLNIKEYYEPFVGGANIIYGIKAENRYGNDIDKDLIAYYNHVITGGESFEEQVSRETFYDMLRDNPQNYKDYERGNIKYMGSFAGNGRDYANPSKVRNFYEGSLKNFKKQIPDLIGVNFSAKDYKELEITNNSFVYCDPPLLEY